MSDQIFDSLSYSKAASGAYLRVLNWPLLTPYPVVLRMVSNYVGEEKFLKGVSIYLKKHLYANSVSKDLWEGIGEATGEGYGPMIFLGSNIWLGSRHRYLENGRQLGNQGVLDEHLCIHKCLPPGYRSGFRCSQ